MREKLRKERNKIDNRKGITLIALVITIIVLLILAGVAIQMLSGDNGILTKAAEAKVKTEEASEKEQVQLAATEALSKGVKKIDVKDLNEALSNTFDEEVNLSGKGSWQYNGRFSNYIIRSNGSVYKTTYTSINLEKFREFMSNNIPEKVIFTNSNIPDYTNDIGKELGEIYVWMDEKTMYVSANKVGCLVKLPTGCTGLFSSFEANGWQTNIKEIDLSYADSTDVTKVTDASNGHSMFASCLSLEKINLSDFNTSKIKDMHNLFEYCYKIEELDLSSFDTSNVTSMNGMFSQCKALKKINLSSFDTSNVINMGGMFFGCINMNAVDISSFDTSNVTNMKAMFQNCYNIKNIYIGNLWNVENVTVSDNMFLNCKLLRNYSSDNTNDKTYANAGENGYLTLK